MDKFSRLFSALAGPHLLSSLVAGAVLLGLSARAAEPTADSLIAASKQATGGAAWDKIVTWHEVGTGSAGGLDGTYESWIDLPTLHSSTSYVLGPTSGGSGWDGTHVWTTDSSKEVRVESSQEAAAQSKQDAYRFGYAFYFPGRLPGPRAYAGTRQADGKTYDAVKITPTDADPFEIWFDRASHRIVREVQLTGDHPQTYLSADYAPFGGILLPRTSIIRIGNDPKYDIVFHANSVVFSGPKQVARYAPPPPPPEDTQWPAVQDSVTLPFQLINNHIYVQASVNGHAPIPFVFDTGATASIESGTAKTLGIPVKGALPMTGFGEKIADFGLAKVHTVSLGGFTLLDQVFTTESSAGWVAVEGADSQGLLGYEFVKRAVLTIDYARRTMTFTKKNKFQPPAGMKPIAFTFNEHIPMVPASLDGISGEYEVDTGSRGALTLMTPFSDAHGLTGKYHASTKATTGYGVGGPTKSILGRAGQFDIGGVVVSSPVVEIMAEHGGGGSETHTAGNIGGDILKRFTVTLDYSHLLLYLQPNDANNQPEVFDRSGLWIMRAKDGAIEIADVTPKSPAAQAGLKIGDEIQSINGQPAKDVKLYELREKFKGAPGTKFDLSLIMHPKHKYAPLVLGNQV